MAQVTAQPKPADLPPVEHFDPKTGAVQRLGDVNPRTGSFVDLSTSPAGTPETAQPGAAPKPQTPLVAPRQNPQQPQATPTARPQAPAGQPQAPAGQSQAPVNTPQTPGNQPATAQPSGAPATTKPTETGQPAAPTNLRHPTPEPQTQPTPQRPPVQAPANDVGTRVIPFMPPGFGGKPPSGPSPRRVEAEGAQTRPTGTSSPARTESSGSGSATAATSATTSSGLTATPAPVGQADTVPPTTQRPAAPQPQPTAEQTPRPVTVPGAGALPPAIDASPRPLPPLKPQVPTESTTAVGPLSPSAKPAATGASEGVRPLAGITVTHPSGTTYELARVDVTPVPGRQLVGSNFPETVQPSTFHKLDSISPGLRGGTFMSTIEGSQSVQPMSLSSGPNGAPQNHTLFWSHQNRQGNQPLAISAAFHNPGTTPVTVNLDVAMSNTTQASYKDLARFPNQPIPPNTEIVLPDGQPNGPGQAAATRRLRGTNDVPPENRTITIQPGQTAFVTLQRVPPDANGRTNIGPEGVGTGTMTVSGGEVQMAMLGTNRGMDQLSQAQRMKLLETAPFMNRDGSKDLAATPLNVMLERGGTFSRLAGVYDAGEVGVKVTNDEAGKAYELRPGQTMVAAIDTKPPHSSVLGPSQSPTIAVEGSQTPGGAVVNGCGYGQMKNVDIPLVNNTDQPLRVRGTWANLVTQTPDSFPTRATIMTEWQTPNGSGKNEVNIAQSRDTLGKEPLFDIVLQPGERGNVKMKFDSPANVTTPWGPMLTTTVAKP
jgi:hypothetical protein